jgi:ketosteroid isomerase-like protein
VSQAKKNLALIERWIETYRNEGHDAGVAMIDQVFAPDVVYSTVLGREVEGRTMRGREELTSLFRELDDLFGGVAYEVEGIEQVSADVIVVLYEFKGEGSGSGLPITMPLSVVYEFEDGLVKRGTVYETVKEGMEAARAAVHA